MFPRSRSIRFAEMPPTRRSLVLNIQMITLERRTSRVAEFYRNAASVFAGLWICGGLIVYFAVR